MLLHFKQVTFSLYGVFFPYIPHKEEFFNLPGKCTLTVVIFFKINMFAWKLTAILRYNIFNRLYTFFVTIFTCIKNILVYGWHIIQHILISDSLISDSLISDPLISDPLISDSVGFCWVLLGSVVFRKILKEEGKRGREKRKGLDFLY